MTSDDIAFIIGFMAFYLSCVGFWICIRNTKKNRVLPLYYTNSNNRSKNCFINMFNTRSNVNINNTNCSNSADLELEQIVIEAFDDRILIPPYTLRINVQPPSSYSYDVGKKKTH